MARSWDSGGSTARDSTCHPLLPLSCGDETGIRETEARCVSGSGAKAARGGAPRSLRKEGGERGAVRPRPGSAGWGLGSPDPRRPARPGLPRSRLSPGRVALGLSPATVLSPRAATAVGAQQGPGVEPGAPTTLKARGRHGRERPPSEPREAQTGTPTPRSRPRPCCSGNGCVAPRTRSV